MLIHAPQVGTDKDLGSTLTEIITVNEIETNK